MDSIKTFFNVGFVVLCLALLWYLFQSGSSDVPRRTTAVAAPIQTQGQTSATIPNQTTRPDQRIGDSPFRESDTRKARSSQPVSTPVVNQATYVAETVYLRRRYSRDNKWGEYQGPMKNGVPHGFGVFKYDDGDIYIGEYRNGQRQGFGNSIFKAKRVVLRKYENGKRVDSRNLATCAYGTKPFVSHGENGIYHGPLRGGSATGYGYFDYKNGNRYIGTYQDGVRNGSGNMIYTDGNVERVEYIGGKLQ